MTKQPIKIRNEDRLCEASTEALGKSKPKDKRAKGRPANATDYL
jgi:hypothetical protein